MKIYLLGLIGLAAIGAGSLLGRLAFGADSCCPEPACNAGCGNGCGCGCGNDGCCHHCPRCGCPMVPVCHPTCEVKKETNHGYCCECKDICIPGLTCPFGHNCENCNEGAAGVAGGGAGGNGSACCPAASCDPNDPGCGCNCRVRTIHKLMVCPETKEHCVRACTVTWTCPKCGACCGCEASPAGGVPAAPAGPAAPTPAPAPGSNPLPAAPQKVTGIMPLPAIGPVPGF